MEKIIGGIIIGLGVLVAVAGLSLLLAFPIMWGWNFVVPSIFGLRSIGLLDAFWLLFLSSTFFKSTLQEKS